jgi:hypothetical protein
LSSSGDRAKRVFSKKAIDIIGFDLCRSAWRPGRFEEFARQSSRTPRASLAPDFHLP